MTPNILFVNTHRFKAPEFADILLSNTDLKTGKPVLRVKDEKFGEELLSNDDEKYYFESEGKIIICKYAKQFFERPKKFVDFIVDLKRETGASRAIFAPGFAVPSNLALSCYLGIDLFDSSSALTGQRSIHILQPLHQSSLTSIINSHL